MSTAPVTLDRSVPLGAVWTSFTLTLRGLLRVKRLLMLLVLFLVPVLVLVTFRIAEANERGRPNRRLSPEQIARYTTKDYLQAEFISVYFIIANVAAPLTILLFATGMVRDEQEDQTLTYLLVRPIPKWALYLAKLLAAVLIAWLLTAFGVVLAMATLWIYSGQPPAEESLARLAGLLPAFGLLIAANGAVFAFLSVLVKRALVLGAVYIALFEGFLANFPFVLRKFTNLHYFQCIVINDIGGLYKKYDVNPRNDPVMIWALAQEIVPDTQEAVLTLLGVFVAAAVLGMYLFTVREFRLKTPEGN